MSPSLRKQYSWRLTLTHMLVLVLFVYGQVGDAPPAGGPPNPPPDSSLPSPVTSPPPPPPPGVGAYAGEQLETFLLPIDVGTTSAGACTTCMAPGSRPMPKYTYLTSQDPTHQELSLSFPDPLPLGYMLQTITTTILGCYHCLLAPSTGSTVSVYIGGLVIQKKFPLPLGSDLCPCKNCHFPVPLPNQNSYPWWPGWLYGHSNSLQLTVLQNAITLSQVNLTFQAVNVTPSIMSYAPTMSPVARSGQPPQFRFITVTGGPFYYADFRYICYYTSGTLVTSDWNATFYAQPAGEGEMTCQIPDRPNITSISFYFYPDTSDSGKVIFPSGSIGPFPFSFYVPPKLYGVVPRECEPQADVNVTLYGKGFFDSPSLACRFGDAVVPAYFLNETALICTVPPAQVGTVDLLVSENGVDWTGDNGITFTYSNQQKIPISPLTPSPAPPISPIIIIAAAVLLGLLTLGSIGYLIYQKLRPDISDNAVDVGEIHESALINFAELEMKERIGRGSFGDVYRASYRHAEVAVKKLPDLTENLIFELIREAKLMLTLRHPNVVQFMGLCATKPDICLVTEFISRGSLYSILHNPNIELEAEHMRRLALDTCKGMAYLHAARIIHRDLKSHNLLVDKNWSVKVADFGLSRAMDQTTATMTACGTPCWTAPEILKNQRYTFKADVYSFGICMWELVTREDPYANLAPYAVILAVGTQGLRPEEPEDWVHPLFEAVTRACWTEEPEERPEFGDLVSRLDDLILPPAPPAPIEHRPVPSPRPPSTPLSQAKRQGPGTPRATPARPVTPSRSASTPLIATGSPAPPQPRQLHSYVPPAPHPPQGDETTPLL